MLMDSLELNVLLVMFGLFLVGLWLEARRTLRALTEESLALEDEAAAYSEADYETIMTRRAARQRLAQMRAQAEQDAAKAALQNAHLSHKPGYFGESYELQIPEFRLIEGGGLSTGGARTPRTREGRKIA
jgi:hypothetical protein